jgi:hypothetical protein
MRVGKRVSNHKLRRLGVESEKSSVPPPHKPKIRFPQRIVKSKLDEQFKKFVELLKKTYINIHFIDVPSQMPSYAKKKIERNFIKERKDRGQ